MLLIPLATGSKKPLQGESWKNLLSDDPDVWEDWKRDGLNCGFPAGANNSVIVDFDNKQVARDFYRRHRSILGPMVETRNGVHAYFAGDTSARKLIINGEEVGDIRARHTYCVFPHSTVKDWNYQFVRGHEWDDLPPFPVDLFPETRKEVQAIDPSVDRLRLISRAMAYATTMEPSVSGQHGHDKLFRFACKMVRQAPNGFGLSIEEAWSIALMFNSQCLPPWDESSLQRKLTEAQRKDG